MPGIEPGITFVPDLRAAVRLAYDVRVSMQGPVQAALGDAHEVMAGKVRERAALELRRAKSKRQPRENLMEQALSDRRNSAVNFTGFAVGLSDWLNESPAALYWRRIESGGPNPMAEEGRIIGFFKEPRSGPDPTLRGGLGLQGRLSWAPTGGFSVAGRRRGGGFLVAPIDRASEGYHTIRAAGEWFKTSDLPLATYKSAFRARGIDFVRLYKLGYGVTPTNRGLVR